MAKPLPLNVTTVTGVELAKIGTYDASTGTCKFTRSDFDTAVEAAESGNLRTPIIKIGHAGGVLTSDDTPAVGRILNLRTKETSDGSYALVGDLQVPAELASVMPIAYPCRSIEGYFNYQSDPMSPKYDFALTGVALLGDTLPAIQSLDDLYATFGVKGQLVNAGAGATPVTADLTQEVTVSTPVAASVQVPYDVTDQFYDQLTDANPGSWAYVCEVWSDFIIVEGTDGELYQVSWAEDGDTGLVTFGAPVRVHTEYVTDPDTAEDGPTPSSAFMLSRGRIDLATGTPVRTSDGPGQSENMTDTTEVTTDTETVEAAADDTTTVETETTTDETVEASAETVTDETPEVPAPVEVTAAATEQVAVLAAQVPDGFQIIASSNLTALQLAASELAELREANRVEARETYLAHACEVEGRFAPAQLDDLRVLFDSNEEAARNFIAKLATGTVPVTSPAGTNKTDTPTTTDEIVARFRNAR